jgi:hypothetical protein
VAIDEWDQLRRELERAGVEGTRDVGRFVSNVQFFGASSFDEKAAMPILLTALPRLSDPGLVSAVAGHLRRPWARPGAFPVLLEAFRRWAPVDDTTGWALGEALGSSASLSTASELVAACLVEEYGMARQMAIHALGRFKRCPEVEPALLVLSTDPTVGLHAMSALRRVLGPSGALPHIDQVARIHAGSPLADQAAREARKIRKLLG